MNLISKIDLIAFAQDLFAITGPHLDLKSSEAPIIDASHDFLDKVREHLKSVQHETDSQGMVRLTQESVFLASLAMRLSILSQTHDGHTQLIGFTKWAASGFPCISMGHKYAASLLVTTASEDAIRFCRPPFHAFMLEVPTGILFTKHLQTGQPDPIRWILVTRLYNQKTPEGWAWGYTTYSEGGMNLFRYGVRSDELLTPTLEMVLESADVDGRPVSRERNNDENEFSFDLSDEDERTCALVGRLIINACLAFSDPTNVKELGTKKNSSRSSYKSRKTDEPVVRNYFLGRAVKHDFREFVRQYATGARRSLTVQGMVRGHHKGQHYGPKNTLYKIIWREPYWRGPEDAPIPLRSIDLGT
jgi:hypothetical protein